jgi:hypothetical protein
LRLWDTANSPGTLNWKGKTEEEMQMTAAIWTHGLYVFPSPLIAVTGRPGDRMIHALSPSLFTLLPMTFLTPSAFEFVCAPVLFLLHIDAVWGRGDDRLCRSDLRLWRMLFGGGFLWVLCLSATDS